MNDEQLSLEECFGDLPDPRVTGRCDHKLMDIVVIAVCAALCGADSWVGWKRWQERRKHGFASF
jgi:hypothetical protein